MQIGVGLILFRPTLFFLEDGDGPEASEYALLKGKREAIEEVAIKKKCGIDFKPIKSVEKPVESENSSGDN